MNWYELLLLSIPCIIIIYFIYLFIIDSLPPSQAELRAREEALKRREAEERENFFNFINSFDDPDVGRQTYYMMRNNTMNAMMLGADIAASIPDNNNNNNNNNDLVHVKIHNQ